MAKRINVGGRYMNVRERNTSKGKKGTFIRRWTHKGKRVTESLSYMKIIFLFVVILLFLLLGAIIIIPFFL